MDTQDMIRRLTAIKLSIIESEAVADTLWLRGTMSTTVCEELDHVLSVLGVDDDELESHYDDHFRPEVARVIK